MYGEMLLRCIRKVFAAGRSFSSSASPQSLIELATAAKERKRDTYRAFVRTAPRTRPIIKVGVRPLSGRRETLARRLFFYLNANRSDALTIIKKWKEAGNPVRKNELGRIVRELRRLKRYDQALVIRDWMVEHKSTELEEGDYALHLDLVAKVRGLAGAELFFKNMPSNMKGESTFTALLHTYVQNKETAKAEGLMKKMTTKRFLSSALPYNCMISLYISLQQYDKAHSTIEELNSHTHPNLDTFNLWLKACAWQNNVDAAEKVFQEMKDAKIDADWMTYSTLANLYIKEKLFQKASSALIKMEKIAFTIDRIAYCSLISMYAAMENKYEIFRIWDKLKRYFGKPNVSEYCDMMVVLVKFGMFKRAELLYTEFSYEIGTNDSRVPNVLLSGLVNKRGMIRVQYFFDRMVERGFSPTYTSWKLMTWGYLKGKETKKALDCFKKALFRVRVWNPDEELVGGVFSNLEEEGDVDGAEEVLTALRGKRYVNTQVYNLLLKTYAMAGKSPPSIWKRMREDMVEPDEETKKLAKLISMIKIRSVLLLEDG